MAEESAANVNPSPEDENKGEHPRDAKPWLDMIENAEKVFEPWHTTCDLIAKDYASLKKLSQMRTDREYQIFYANLEVLKPSIYSRPPQPVVVPRFKDRKPVPRKTSEMLERALVTSFDTQKVHETLKKVRDDLALCGRGVIWNRLEVYDDRGEPEECVKYEWLHRKDFLHEPSRIWAEVGWVARGTWLTKEQGEKRFVKNGPDGKPELGPDGKPVSTWTEITYEDAKDTDDTYKVQMKARVWELWHKEKNLVVWVHPHAKQVLDIAAPHLMLEGFFPCPRPAYGTCEQDSLVPVPDACFYKDQLEEINELTARISSLSESLKLQILYPAAVESASDAIKLAVEMANSGEQRRIWIPVSNVNVFQGGNLKDMFFTMPIGEVAVTIKELVALRKQLIDDVYQISGISDIMRGQTEASETLGAQQLKSQYGSIRIKDRQGEMVRLADGTLNISGEIMAENFSPQTLLSMSQTLDLPKQADILQQHQAEAIKQIQALAAQQQQPPQEGQPPPDPAQFEQQKQAIIVEHQKAAEAVVTVEAVFALLRGERMRPFVLQIATDSTIQPDENAEKQARNEFGVAFSQITTALAPLVQVDPAGSADFAGEMIKFILAPYRAGRQMEQAVDDWVEQMKQKAKQPPPPNPEVVKAETEAKALQEKHAMDMQDRQEERATRQQEAAAETARLAQEDAAKQRDADRQAAQDARDAMIADAEAKARVAEIERKANADTQAQAHALKLQQGQERLMQLQIELAEVKLKEAKEKPAPKPNGNGAEVRA